MCIRDRHPAGAAHQGKGHIRTDLCAQRAQRTHGKVRTVQLVHAHQNSGSIGKAALAFFDYTGLLAGVDITIYKNTPVRAGMAGGSADAAAVLVGMNELYGAHLSMSELCALGAKIGADVPFALMGGTCRVQGLSLIHI